MRRNVWNVAICTVITLCLLFIGYFVFWGSYLRLFEVIKDFGKSIRLVYYCLTGNGYYEGLTSMNTSKIMKNNISFPTTSNDFGRKVKSYFKLLINKKNFILWLENLGAFFVNFFKVVICVVPIILVLFLILKRVYNKENNNFGEDTKALKVFKRTVENVFYKIKQVITDFLLFLKEHKIIKKIWIVIFLFHFNVISIIVGFISCYLKFFCLFNFGDWYYYFYLLIMDLQMFFNIYGLLFLIVFVIKKLKKIRVNKALRVLRHLEARNCGFINSLSIVSITVGSMGKKKTTVITDMGISQEVMFRQKALEILTENDLRFPYFSWVEFEKDLERAIEHDEVYNLATVKEWVKKKELRFNGDYSKLYNYDGDKYGMFYYDGLKVYSLFDVLSIYARAYFIYILKTSLIVSNYSIRSDNLMDSVGNFPFWITDFFCDKGEGRHSHILDFDVLRLGKKVLNNNKNIGSFEFGVVLVTEIGKERGNNLELKEIKGSSTETNQKNDLFNSWLKMCRHSATIDNFPFIKVFTDEQRPESWGADARDLCEVLHICDSSELKIALPFYTLGEMLSEWTFNFFIGLYRKFRYKRGDNTLLVYLLKKVTNLVYQRHKKIVNLYGYRTVKVNVESGTLDGKIDTKKYYLMNKKIYSSRFSTDCFSDYFDDLAKKSKVGLNDYDEYEFEKASVDELKLQNSYFINNLYKK